jgi:hypothetical protein
VAAELAGRRVAVPVALAASTAALAAGQALAHLEGAVPAAHGAALVLEPDGTHRSRPARRHPDCGCRALSARPTTNRPPVAAA